jgi:hypothetical protein
LPFTKTKIDLSDKNNWFSRIIEKLKAVTLLSPFPHNYIPKEEENIVTQKG